MKRDHGEVLKTLQDAGLLTRHAVKSIKGQIENMSDRDREQHLRAVIKSTKKKAEAKAK